jgi:hypothetical protein
LVGKGARRRLPGVIGGLPGHTGTEYQPTTATVTIEV